MANGRIKQINTGTSTYDIEALYFGNRSASDWEGMIHGTVDTYVIAAQTSGTTDYKAVVESSSAQCSTTVAKLNTLTGSSTTNTYKVGDIVLMGATSDGKINFDRWISKISGTTVYLDVLETQVATHHHDITPSKSNAVTSVTPVYNTTDKIAKVGDGVTVVTGVSGAPVVVTSLTAFGTPSHSLTLSSASSGGLGHSHTVESHNHSVTLGDTVLVSTRANAFTTLTSVSTTLHGHNTNVTAAGGTTNSSTSNVVTGGSTTGVMTSLSYEDATTEVNANGLQTNNNSTITTGTNTKSLATSVQVSSSTTVNVNTGAAGTHSHTVNVTTSESVIKTVNVAGSVITSITFGAGSLPSVQSKVVKSVTSVAKTVMTGATLNNNAFTFTSHNVIGDVLYLAAKSQTVGITPATTTVSTIGGLSTGDQSNGSLPSLTYTSVAQTYTSGKVNSTGTAENAGSHSHGFAHTHTIESHTHSVASHSHSIPSHSHSYKKSVTGGTANAFTTLTSVSTTLHGHSANVTAAGSIKNSSTSNVVTGGDTTSVIAKLKADAAYSTDSKTPGTDTKYYKLTGSITHPGYTITTASLKDLISSGTVTQAAAATVSVMKSVTAPTSEFVTNVNKTGVNKGGNP